MLRICSGLVVLNSQWNVFRFVNTSAQDFLELQPDFVSQSTNSLVATSCLRVIIQGILARVKPELYLVEAFYYYGALYWPEHCSTALSNSDETLALLIEDFIFEYNEISPLFLGWLEDIREHREAIPCHHELKRYLNAVTSPMSTPLFTASAYGLVDIFRRLDHASEYDWSQKNDLGQSGLYLACANGHKKIVKFFIDHGADIHSSSGRHGSPLQAACFEGHVHVVQLLIEGGADPKAGGALDNALQASILGGNQDITLRLLNFHRFEIRDQDSYNKAIYDAAEAGFLGVIQHLQREYSSTYATSTSGQQRALELAILKGQRAVPDRFLQKAQNPKDLLPEDAVAVAAVTGQKEMVCFLLDKGLDIKTEGQLGSPLRVASLMGHESTARMLLDRGADVGARGRFGGALQAAAARGHVSLTDMLLHEGAKPNEIGGHFENALQAAAYFGHTEVVKILLHAGTSVHYSGFFKDAFHAAASGGQEHIIHLFLERGFSSYTGEVQVIQSSSMKTLTRFFSGAQKLSK